jgi:hypothetical protein
MRLDRNIGRGNKYSLILNRKYADLTQEQKLEVERALQLLHSLGVLIGDDNTPGTRFFVLRYEDIFTAPALVAYSQAAQSYAMGCSSAEKADGILEYASDVMREAYAAQMSEVKVPE